MLGSQEALEALDAMVDDGNDAALLRGAFAETSTLTDVVRRQSARWMSDEAVSASEKSRQRC